MIESSCLPWYLQYPLITPVFSILHTLWPCPVRVKHTTIIIIKYKFSSGFPFFIKYKELPWVFHQHWLDPRRFPGRTKEFQVLILSIVNVPFHQSQCRAKSVDKVHLYIFFFTENIFFTRLKRLIKKKERRKKEKFDRIKMNSFFFIM